MMQRFSRHCLRLLPATVIGVALIATPVNAQGTKLSDEQRQAVQTHCIQAQSSLKRFETSELLTRLDRGRAYEQLLNQINALNKRFDANHTDASDLPQITSDLQSNVDNFRNTYDRDYDKTLLSAVKIDCRADPDGFYELIVTARDQRAQIAKYLADADAELQQYQTTLLKIKTAMTQPATGSQPQ